MPQTRATDKNGKSAKWQRRRHEIVDASAKVFAERGYHATSTTELCEANGIGKGALYYYIGSKEELLAAIHDRVMDEVMLGADRVDRADGTPPERLALLGEELLDVIFRFPDHVWVFLHDFPALTGKNAEIFRQRRRAYERRVEEVFRGGIESGDFRPLDTRLAVTAWLGMHNYTYLGLRAGGTPPERLAMLGEELLDVIFRFPDHVWVFLHDFPALTGKNAETFRLRRRAYERRVEEVFRDGVESGDFRPLDVRLAVNNILNNTDDLQAQWQGYTYKPEGIEISLSAYYRF